MFRNFFQAVKENPFATLLGLGFYLTGWGLVHQIAVNCPPELAFLWITAMLIVTVAAFVGVAEANQLFLVSPWERKFQEQELAMKALLDTGRQYRRAWNRGRIEEIVPAARAYQRASVALAAITQESAERFENAI